MDESVLREYFKECISAPDFIRKYRSYREDFRLNDKEKIIEVLRWIEKSNYESNLLGVLYIVAIEESKVANIYINKFLERNKKQLIAMIQNDGEDIVYCMRIIYICLMYLNEAERDVLCHEIFSKDFKNKWEEYTPRHYAAVLKEAVDGFENSIGWEKYYYKIITNIFYARSNDTVFLHHIEVEFKKKWWKVNVGDNSAKEYFELLYEYKDYEAIKMFLDKFNGKVDFLAYEAKEFINKLYDLPAPELWTWGKWYSGQIRGEKYSYEEWKEDIISRNSDEECLKWLELTVYYHALKECIKNKQINEFEELLNESGKYSMFDMKKIKYMKQIIECFAFVVNQLLIEENFDLLKRFLEKISDININSYDSIQYVVNWNQKDSVKRGYRYPKMINTLFEGFKNSVEDFIKIYMNTHLKYFVNIEVIVEKCNSVSKGRISELFANYPLRGKVTLGNNNNSIRDMIFISAIEVASEVSFEKYEENFGNKNNNSKSKEIRYILNTGIRCDEIWYRDNKKDAELIRTGDKCTFYVNSFVEGVGILAKNIEIDEEIKQQRRESKNKEYFSQLIKWLDKIQLERKIVMWDNKDTIYSVMYLDNKSRIIIYEKILDVIIALQNDSVQLENFIKKITFPPFERINEFRFIETSLWINFEIEADEFKRLEEVVVEKANLILSNKNISQKLKKDIYLNTIIRKYIDLYHVCQIIGDELFIETAEKSFVMPLRFRREENGVFYFWTGYRINEKSDKANPNKLNKKSGNYYSEKDFCFYGEHDKLIEGRIYYTILKEYDEKKDCFILEDIDVSKEEFRAWNKYLYILYDVIDLISYMEQNNDDYDKIARYQDGFKKKMGEYAIEISTQTQLWQFVRWMNNVFKKVKYDFMKVNTIINVLGTSNPIFRLKVEDEEFIENNKEEYIKGYRELLKNYIERDDASPVNFCDIYFGSYLKLFVGFEKFINDIQKNGLTKESIVVSCQMKGYI